MSDSTLTPDARGAHTRGGHTTATGNGITHVAPDGGAGELARLLTSRQTSELTGIPESTLWRYSRAGVMPAPRKIGHLIRYDRLEIERWIQDGCPRVDGKDGR